MRRSKSVRFFDFSGGLNSNSHVTALAMNQAMDLQNINLTGPVGSIEKRRGNTTFNSSAMVSSSTAISGLGYFRKSDGTDSLCAVAGSKFFTSGSLSGTMTDSTGAVSITSGADKIWTCQMMNDLLIFAGGAPDAPFSYSGSGNAAALAGSPPSGRFIVVANNRAFIGNTSANPSRIYWSILGSPSDWTGSGSGSSDVQTNDGDTLVGAAPMGVDHLILFKQNSIHDLVIRTSPFPLYALFRNVGAVSKRGIVTVNGVIYFITPEPRMKATDGSKVIEFPDTIDDVWDGLNKNRLQYIHGIYYPRLNQIMWFCSSGSSTTHNLCIIWDIDRKCWLRHTTGYSMNVSAIAQDYLLYAGAYNGKIYKQDVASTYTDASETSPGAINAYWKSGWIDAGSLTQAKNIPYVDINFSTQTAGIFEFGYAYDFATQTKNMTVSMLENGDRWGSMLWGVGVWGGQTDKTKLLFLKGRGKFFQFFIRNQNPSENLAINGFEVPVKVDAPYALR